MDEGQVGALLEAVDRSSGRFLLGLTGPPGAGKSTIAALIEAAANESIEATSPWSPRWTVSISRTRSWPSGGCSG